MGGYSRNLVIQNLKVLVILFDSETFKKTKQIFMQLLLLFFIAFKESIWSLLDALKFICDSEAHTVFRKNSQLLMLMLYLLFCSCCGAAALL